jgi:asparagine synthase (glutamine-hydrolysing)
MDLPTIDGLNTWLVSRAARAAGFKVAVSGLGGDELFGGYPSFRRLPWAERWSPVLGLVPYGAIAGGSRGDEVRRLGEMLAPRASLSDRYAATRAVWSRAALRRAGAATVPPLDVDEPDAALPVATRVSLLESQCYMRSMLLRDADQMGMGQSLEIRVPFLDHVAFEGVLAGVGAESAGKARLLEAAGDLVPPEVRDRKKRGFVLPMESWLRGSLASFLQQGLARTEELGLLRRSFVRRVREDFAARRLSWSRPWQLAVLGHWAARRRMAAAA